MEYQNFTSLPPEQEATFVVYERTSSEAGKKAMTLGAICGAVVGVFALMLFFSYDAPRNAHAVDPVSDIEEEAPKTKAIRPAPEPAAVEPTPEAAPEAAAAGTEPAAAPVTEAPPPPAGATKAPPTALVNP